MFITEDSRKYGYGTEAIKALCDYFKDIGFNEVRLGVSLKNWPGLRFWHKCGFDKITLVVADGDFSVDRYACLELKKSLITLD